MEGKYRVKDCKLCGIKHRKRGPYCSKPCSNMDRQHSKETKAKIAESVRKFRIEQPNENIQYAMWCNMRKQRNPDHDPETDMLIGDYSIGIEQDYLEEGGDIWSPV